MKNIFSNIKTLLKYSFTFFGVSIILGLIFSLTFGFNTSAEYGNLYEITIFSFDNDKIEDYKKTTLDVLDEYGYTAKEVFTEEHTDSDTLVIRYESSSSNNAVKIQADITEKLALNENLVKVESLSASSAKVESIKLLITLGVAVLVLFVFGLIRHNWKFAVAQITTLILGTILPLSVMAFTRTELSLTSLGLVIILGIVQAVLYSALYSKMMSIQKYQEKPKTFKENYLDYATSIKSKVLIPLALGLLVFVCLMFTFQRALVNVGLAGLVALIINAGLLAIITPAFQILLNKEEKK